MIYTSSGHSETNNFMSYEWYIIVGMTRVTTCLSMWMLILSVVWSNLSSPRSGCLPFIVQGNTTEVGQEKAAQVGLAQLRGHAKGASYLLHPPGVVGL
jgi:hypothetical protein